MSDNATKKSIRNPMPMAFCPDCKGEFQVSDWYDFKGGETIYCGLCNAELGVEGVNPVMYVDLIYRGEVTNGR